MNKELLVMLWGEEFFVECLDEAMKHSPTTESVRIELIIAIAIGKILKK